MNELRTLAWTVGFACNLLGFIFSLSIQNYLAALFFLVCGMITGKASHAAYLKGAGDE